MHRPLVAASLIAVSVMVGYAAVPLGVSLRMPSRLRPAPILSRFARHRPRPPRSDRRNSGPRCGRRPGAGRARGRQ